MWLTGQQKKKSAYLSQVNSSVTLVLIPTSFFFIKSRTIYGGLNNQLRWHFHYVLAVFLPIFITPATISMENLQGIGAMISERQWLSG